MTQATNPLRCEFCGAGIERKSDMTSLARFLGPFVIRPSETLCYPCAVRRLWRASQGAMVLLGVAGGLVAVVEGELAALGLLLPVVPATLYAEWRIGKLPPAGRG